MLDVGVHALACFCPEGALVRPAQGPGKLVPLPAGLPGSERWSVGYRAAPHRLAPPAGLPGPERWSVGYRGGCL